MPNRKRVVVAAIVAVVTGWLAAANSWACPRCATSRAVWSQIASNRDGWRAAAGAASPFLVLGAVAAWLRRTAP